MALAPKIGIYFYPWYNADRWREFPRPFTPSIGEYDSRDPAVLAWQLDHIAAIGVDYVVFEICPEHDWCYPTMAETIDRALPELKRRNLGHTFLVDTKCNPGMGTTLNDIEKCINQLESAGWTREMELGPEGRPMLMVFAPYPSEAVCTNALFGHKYQMVHAGWFAHWGHPDAAHDFEYLRPYWQHAADTGRTLAEELPPLGFMAFWEQTEEVNNFNGFCAVAPGYDDRPLKRNPQLVAGSLEREGGAQYVRRFKRALAQRPQHIIIYSWNEYFEASTIEPTLEYGNQYLQLTRDIIAEHVKPERLLPPWPAADLAAYRQSNAAAGAIAGKNWRQTPLFQGVEPLAGFHPVEGELGERAVWTTSHFELRPTGDATRLTWQLCYNGEQGRLELLNGDAAVRSVTLRYGWQCHYLDLDSAPAGALRFRVDPVPALVHDSRELGIRIRSLSAQ